MRTIKLFGIIILVLFSVNSFSQVISVGPKVGLNINPIGKDKLNATVFNLGINAGGKLDVQINNWFSVSAEVLFSTQKKSYSSFKNESLAKKIINDPFFNFLPQEIKDYVDSILQFNHYINDTIYSNTNGNAKLGYLEIPIMARFNYNSLYFSVGPYFSYLLTYKSKETFSQDIPLLKTMSFLDTIEFAPMLIGSYFPGFYNPVTSESTTNSIINKFDIGIIADISYKINDNIFVGVRYNQGLLNYRIDKIKKNDFLSCLSFNVCYLFNFNEKTDAMLK